MSLEAFDLQRAALLIDGTPTEKHVLLVLATRCNRQSQCNPGMPRIATDTGLSERSVLRAILQLERDKHITRDVKAGIGTTYTIHPRTSVTPDTASPLTECPNTPDTVSPKQPVTPIIPQKATPSSVARAKPTRVPSNFMPAVKPDSITGKAMAGWPPGYLAEQIEHFIDHHTVKGTLSLDWQASWRTWVKQGKRFNGTHQPNHAASAGRPQRASPALALLREAEFQERAERDQAFGGGTGFALQALGSG